MNEDLQPVSSSPDDPAADEDKNELNMPVPESAYEDAEDTNLDLLFVSELPAPRTQPIYEGDTSGTPQLDSFDIDAALAAVASLSTLVDEDNAPESEAEDDSADDAAFDLHPASDAAEIADELMAEGFTEVAEDDFALADDGEFAPESTEEPAPAAIEFEDTVVAPPLFYLQRGQLASVLPALLLIGGAAGLAALILTETALSAELIAGGIIAAIGVIFLGQWLSSRYHAAGNFFFGTWLLLLAGTGFYLTQPTSPGLAAAPLFVVVTGLALVLTATFSQVGRGVLALGLIISVGGIAALLITTDLLTLPENDILTTIAPVPVVILLLILVIPLLRRR